MDITFDCDSNTIGGSATNAPNVIAFNGNDGVQVVVNSTMDTISRNSIFGNTNLGINLHNENGSAGGNNLEPAPVLTSYTTLASGSIQTGWTLGAAASTSFTIEFFASALGSSSGVSEGQTFLTSMPVTTGSSGNASFSESLTLPAGETFVTATATDPNGNTSQFSLQATTTALTSSLNPSTLGTNVTFTAVVADPATGTPTGTVTFTIDGQAETPSALAVVNGVDQATIQHCGAHGRPTHDYCGLQRRHRVRTERVGPLDPERQSDASGHVDKSERSHKPVDVRRKRDIYRCGGADGPNCKHADRDRNLHN